MSRPVLWHIGVSHYSEKARWALDYKGVEHERRAPAPPAHMAYALWLTRGAQKTFPVLELDGEAIGDSSAIIGALEARYPEPALYPEDPVARRRALDLEEFFDEELGPAVRLVGWHHMRQDRERLGEVATRSLPGPLRRLGPARAAITSFAGTYVNLRYGVADREAELRARAVIVTGVDRLEAELGGGDYLAGDAFSVADLTAAALLYPFVLPPEGPDLPSAPDTGRPFVAELRERPFWSWVERIFARHRKRPV